MPHSGAKNSIHHETFAQEILKIFSISWMRVKNTISDGAAPAQKVRKFPPICHSARESPNLMPRRTIRNEIKSYMLAMVVEFSAFCAFETGI